MSIKRVFLVFGLLLCGGFALAQSASEMAMAKQLAKQQGYSDAQIEQMVQQYNNGANEPKGTTVTPVDRNSAAQVQVVQMQAVAAQPAPAPATGIFGHSLFRNAALNFVPSYNIPTPENYKLSGGDEVVIDIWGDVITNITATISPDGSVNIPNLGPVYLQGQTVKKAEQSLKDYLSKIYSGISAEEPSTFVKLSLGKTKTVTVNVVGDVTSPGSYTLPSLSTIASAMYLAKGPNGLGTVRAIKLYRNSKLVSTFDVYEFLLKGSFNSNVRLEDNDAIIVAPYYGVVTVNGGVKRPMKYEITEKETLDKVLGYAGKFVEDAYIESVHVDRVAAVPSAEDGAIGESFDVMAEQFASFELKDGDVVTVKTNARDFKNRVNISGAVWRPGTYAINNSTSNLKQLITAAGGIRENAYTQRGIIYRLGENKEKIQLSFNVTDVIIGKESIELLPDDQVTIFSARALEPARTVRISGEVNSPANGGVYEYREGITIGDLILMAGGVTDAATLAKVEVARRVRRADGDVVELSDTVAKVMHFDLLKNPAGAEFKLEPFDIVFVRRSASFKAQQSISISGEVNYPGAYVVESNVVRLSDIVNRAGGFNKSAYVKGAKLTRTLTKEEYDRLVVAMEIAKTRVADSVELDMMEIGESFTIAIDLEKAVAEPGGIADVVLRTGDVISVPKFNSTVKISGAVMYPNTVSYNPKYKFSNYLANAGGVTQNGIKRKTYMVHMNGSVAIKGDPNFKVQPGTEIVVPTREERKGSGQTVAAILGIATTTASLAAMVTSIVNNVK